MLMKNYVEERVEHQKKTKQLNKEYDQIWPFRTTDLINSHGLLSIDRYCANWRYLQRRDIHYGMGGEFAESPYYSYQRKFAISPNYN